MESGDSKWPRKLFVCLAGRWHAFVHFLWNDCCEQLEQMHYDRFPYTLEGENNVRLPNPRFSLSGSFSSANSSILWRGRYDTCDVFQSADAAEWPYFVLIE